MSQVFIMPSLATPNPNTPKSPNFFSIFHTLVLASSNSLAGECTPGSTIRVHPLLESTRAAYYTR